MKNKEFILHSHERLAAIINNFLDDECFDAAIQLGILFEAFNSKIKEFEED